MATRYLELKVLANRIKERLDIVDVIGSRIYLNSSLKAICPFHEDRNPSLSVNQSGQFYHCFGCHVGGDIFNFLMRYESRSFEDVVLELAQMAGIPIPISIRKR